jgi:hypothetical protein
MGKLKSGRAMFLPLFKKSSLKWLEKDGGRAVT